MFSIFHSCSQWDGGWSFPVEVKRFSNWGAYIWALLDWTFNISPFSRLIIPPRIVGPIMFQSNSSHLGLTAQPILTNITWKRCSVWKQWLVFFYQLGYAHLTDIDIKKNTTVSADIDIMYVCRNSNIWLENQLLGSLRKSFCRST